VYSIYSQPNRFLVSANICISLAPIQHKLYHVNKILLLSLSAVLFFSSCTKKSIDGEETSKPIAAPSTLVLNGTTYSTVKIGNKTWTDVNYNGPGGVNPDNVANDINYGKLYSLAEAENITLPAGWRLPSRTDFEDLIKSFKYTIDYQRNSDGLLHLPEDECKKLKSKDKWHYFNGINSSGFNAYPTGSSIAVTGVPPIVGYIGYRAMFLSSTSSSNSSPYGHKFYMFCINNYSDSKPEANYAEMEELERIEMGSLRFVKDN
jgi:uncharacterized protein (TIGR02145 family)